jgi:hypothetical protein
LGGLGPLVWVGDRECTVLCKLKYIYRFEEIGEKIAKLLVNFVSKLCFKVNFKANYAGNF